MYFGLNNGVRANASSLTVLQLADFVNRHILLLTWYATWIQGLIVLQYILPWKCMSWSQLWEWYYNKTKLYILLQEIKMSQGNFRKKGGFFKCSFLHCTNSMTCLPHCIYLSWDSVSADSAYADDCDDLSPCFLDLHYGQYMYLKEARKKVNV